MTSADQPGEQPYRPGAGSGEPPTGGDRPTEPVPQSWDWAIDPPPPEGPDREPTPDPAAGSTIDEVPDPLPLTGRFPDTVAPGTGPPSPPRPERPTAPPRPERPTAPPPDWSTPETRVSTPPLSGYPPAPPQPPIWAPSGPGGAAPSGPGGAAPSGPGGAAPTGPGGAAPTGPGGAPGPGTGPPPPGGTAGVPEFARPTDRRWWFLLGLVAAVLSCCCVAAAVIALAWGPDIYAGLRDRKPRVVGLNQPARDGDLEFQVHEVRCGLTEVGDPLVSQLAIGQFCVVGMAVRNLGHRPVTFQDTLQVAYGPAGQRFGVDSSAGLLANADQLGFLSEINPGNRVTGAVVYDIPPDARIVRLRLRASATSPGIQVRTG